MRCGQETTTVPMRRNEGTCCHDQKLPSLDLRRTMPGKESREERTFKRLDCATPGPHLRSEYILTGMRAGCCTSDWKWGFYMIENLLRRENHFPFTLAAAIVSSLCEHTDGAVRHAQSRCGRACPLRIIAAFPPLIYLSAHHSIWPPQNRSGQTNQY